MEGNLINVLINTIEDYFATHCKIKVAKITAINGNYASIEFFENALIDDKLEAVPPVQNVPLLQLNASFGGDCGIVVPYAVGDNVKVCILDNINKQAFFENNNIFQNFFPHNLANAVIIGRVDTRQQEARTTEGVLIYKAMSEIEVLGDGIRIAKSTETLRNVIKDLANIAKDISTALSQSTVMVMGSPVPLSNASEFSALASEVDGLVSRIENLLK